ncbi:MAG: Sir2 family NAD-dependent protein deacetylase, partial [Spirochaetota bacterium]
MEKSIADAVAEIRSSHSAVAFTGAGISVESGIPPFRGENGIWNIYDPRFFDIDYFIGHEQNVWEMLAGV